MRTIVFVPGFLASSLNDALTAFGLGSVWLNPTRLLAGAFPRLRLAVPSEGLPAPRGRPLFAGRPLPFYYGPFFTFLRVLGYRVVSPPGDWRYPLAFDSAAVLALILRESESAPVGIVAHSRGGLVVRHALGQLGQLGQLGRVERVVGIGVPHTGSLAASAALAGWGSLQARIHTLGSAVRFGNIDPLGFAEIREVLRSWPALYQFLPPPGASWLRGVPGGELFSPSTYARSPLRPVAAHLAAALAGWSEIPPSPPAVPWVDLAGYGSYTYTTVPDIRNVCDPHNFAGQDDGDGTVPLASALQSGRLSILTPSTHDPMCLDGRSWPALRRALAGTLDADVKIAGPILG